MTPDPVVDVVPDDGGEGKPAEEYPWIQRAAGGEAASREQQRVSR
jgi:hypothetical protein